MSGRRSGTPEGSSAANSGKSPEQPATSLSASLRLVAGAVVTSVLVGTLDASLVVLQSAHRRLSALIIGESLALHGVLALLLAAFLIVILSVVPKRKRPQWLMDSPFRLGVAAMGAAYFLMFAGLYGYITLVAIMTGGWSPSSAIETLVSIPALLFIAILIAGTIVCGRLLYWLSGRPGSPGVSSRRLGGAVAVVAVLAVAAFVIRESSSDGDAGSVPSGAGSSFAGRSGFKNVILIVMDTTRRDRLSVYGHDRPTSPNLERLAREGTLFTEASANASFTLTSHASLLTGKLPSMHGATLRTPFLDPSSVTLAEKLREAGVRTAGFVANRVLRLESGVARGFEFYDDIVDPQVCFTALWDVVHNFQSISSRFVKPLRFNGRPHVIEDHQRSATDQNRRIFRWLDENRDEPFFLFINYYDPHWPYLPSREYREKFVPPYSGPVTGFASRDNDYPEGYQMTPEDDQHLLALYDAEIAYLDGEIGNLLGKLEELAILDDTLIVITADHGEYFGERGMYSHRYVYEPVIAVALLMRLPGAVPAGRVVDSPVHLVDVVPTVLELAGLEAPGDVQGQSLAPVLADTPGGQLPPRLIFAECFQDPKVVRRMARDGNLKLIKTFDGKDNEELYNLEFDRGESSNLLSTGSAPADGSDAALDGPPATTLTDAVDDLDAKEKVRGRDRAPKGMERKLIEELRGLGYLQ